ncbi:hypothetical protein F511_40835 [Dorcoceras hygrometricum]|uniref:Uncharacterized protein n=1 Tax=Dorcoceras hygrometricum TaxID=472368 RepID=A0A2Z7DC50_9LAMI|nr:hypothetical protein F511_40835 [Dorcoceras hygrometricum]
MFSSEKLLYTLEKSPPKEALVNASPEELSKLDKLWEDELKVHCYMMGLMYNEMQQRFENTEYAADIHLHLKELYGENSRTKRFTNVNELVTSRMHDGTINQGTATQLKQVSFLLLRQFTNLTPVLPLNKVLTVHTKLRTVGIPYPEAETSGRTIKFHCTKKPATSRSYPRSFDSLKWVTIGRATHKESSATKFTQNNGGKRRQSTEKSHGEQ